MIWKSPVAFTEQNQRIETDPVEQLLCDDRSGAITAIDNAGDVLRDAANAIADIFDISIDDRLVSQGALSTLEALGNRDLVDLLNILTIDRPVADSQLESVELGWIVRSRDLNSAGNSKVVLRPVRERRWNNANVDNVQSALEKTGYKLAMEIRSTRPIIPTAISPETPLSLRNVA